MQCTAYISPPPLELSHKYATEVDFQIYEMGPLAYYMADDFFIPNPPLVITHFIIIKFYCYPGNQRERLYNASTMIVTEHYIIHVLV